MTDNDDSIASKLCTYLSYISLFVFDAAIIMVNKDFQYANVRYNNYNNPSIHACQNKYRVRYNLHHLFVLARLDGS